MEFQINWPYISILQGCRIFFTHSCCIDGWTKVWYHQYVYNTYVTKPRLSSRWRATDFGLTGCQVIAPTLWQATWRSSRNSRANGWHVETETTRFFSRFYPKSLGDSSVLCFFVVGLPLSWNLRYKDSPLGTLCTLHPGDAEVCSAWLGSPSSGRNVLHLLIERISPRLFPVVRQGWRYKTFPSHIIEILKIFLLGLLDDAEFGSWQSAWPFFHSIPIDEVIGREAYNYKLFASEGEPCLFKPLVCP